MRFLRRGGCATVECFFFGLIGGVGIAPIRFNRPSIAAFIAIRILIIVIYMIDVLHFSALASSFVLLFIVGFPISIGMGGRFG